MNRFRWAVLVMMAAVPCLEAQDALATIKTAEYALGMIRGPQRIDAINTMEVWGTGTSSDPRPGTKIAYHASYSYRTPAMRVDIARSNPEERQIQVFNGMFAWDESVPGGGFIKGSTATPAPGALKDRLLQMWTTPHGVLKAAERADKEGNAFATIATDGQPFQGIRFPLDGPLQDVKVTVMLNNKYQVEKVETTTDNPVLGDMDTETTYSDYKDLGEIATDVLFPARIVRKRGGAAVLDLTVTKVDANNPYVVFPVPENVEKGK